MDYKLSDIADENEGGPDTPVGSAEIPLKYFYNGTPGLHGWSFPPDPDGTGFDWANYLFSIAAQSVASESYNLSGLDIRGYTIRAEEYVDSPRYLDIGSVLAEYPGTAAMRLRLVDFISQVAYVGNDIVPETGGETGNWSAIADETELGTINACLVSPDTCAELWISSDMATDGNYAEEYSTQAVQFHFAVEAASRRVPANSECTAGSGTFRLFPWRIFNYDNDEDYTAVLFAIQTGGTGVMTNAAWVTAITWSDHPGVPVRVGRVNKVADIGSTNDLLGAPNVVSALVPSTGAQFGAGVVSGNPPFCIEELDGDTTIGPQLSMTWTCATPTSQEEVFATPGYSFALAEIGCSNAPTQKFTMRMPAASPGYVRLELYGNPNIAEVSRLDTTVSPPEFTFRRGPFKITGAVVENEVTYASIRFDEISVEGVDVCTDGTYTLDAE